MKKSLCCCLVNLLDGGSNNSFLIGGVGLDSNVGLFDCCFQSRVCGLITSLLCCVNKNTLLC